MLLRDLPVLPIEPRITLLHVGGGGKGSSSFVWIEEEDEFE